MNTCPICGNEVCRSALECRADFMPDDPAKYSPCDMTTLAVLIRRDWDNAAYAEWRKRYGHDYPVYAVIDGQELKHDA